MKKLWKKVKNWTENHKDDIDAFTALCSVFLITKRVISECKINKKKYGIENKNMNNEKHYN